MQQCQTNMYVIPEQQTLNSQNLSYNFCCDFVEFEITKPGTIGSMQNINRWRPDQFQGLTVTMHGLELGKEGLKCPRRPSGPFRRPRPSSRPFLMSAMAFMALQKSATILKAFFDVRGTYQTSMAAFTAFFDGRRPFLIAAGRSIVNFRFN